MTGTSGTPENRSWEFPVSYAQRRLWYLDQLVPGSPFYNIHLAIPLPFDVDAGRLRETIDEIVWRHDTLRTTFVVRDGEAQQVVVDQRDHELACVDLRAMSPDERQREAARVATEQAQVPFDLAHGPLLRTTLLRLGLRDCHLLLTFHHIIADAWSVGTFVRELGVIYAAFVDRRPSPLPPLTFQYPDYAVWQRRWLVGEQLERLVDWWRAELAGVAALELPLDFSRPAVPTFRGGTHILELPAAMVTGVRALAERSRATEFMVLLAAFALLLHRYSGQDDIVLGAPIAGRTRSEFEPLIGFFVNTMVLRIDLSGDPTFQDLLARVRRTTLDALDHQELPFEKLVEVLHPQRDLSRNPLFQVSFQLHNEPGTQGSAESSAPESSQRSSVFDLSVDLWRTGTGLTARIDYAADLFRPATIARLADHYVAALRAVLADPSGRSAATPLGREEEAAAVARQSGNIVRALAEPHEVASRLVQIADRYPRHPAVVDARQELSYAELLDRGRRIAQALRRRGVSVGDAVGVAMERSAERIVALVGIVLAGAAYVAIEPEVAGPRLTGMLARAGVRLVLADRAPDPSCETEYRTLDPDLLVAEHAPEDGSPSAFTAVDGDHPIYIAFTSGTTGVPKGVAVRHRSVVNLVDGADFAQLGPGATMLQLAPLSFDATTIEIWFALLSGAALAVHPPGPASLDEIGDFIDRKQVTHAFFTAGLFHQMIDARLSSVTRLRVVMTGGDVVSPGHVTRALSTPRPPRVVNLYGPTEGTVYATACVLDHVADVTQPLSIGRAVANVRVHVLDAAGRPVPVGVPGDLHIAGLGVALGYVGMPEETAAAFVPDLTQPAQRMYRTGDRVRVRADGQLEFLGRTDRQVKVRGFRVEAQAVEMVLRGHPGVRDAIVAPVPDATGARVLGAWVVWHPDAAPASESLRRHLAAELPSYMHPNAIVWIDALPLRPNGKLDLAALPRPEAQTRVYVPPRTEAEEALVPIWEQVLGIPRVGADDDFFVDLGGHSLLGTLLVARIRDTFRVDLPLRRLFEAPTPSRLARIVEELLLAEIESLDERLLSAGPDLEAPVV